MKKKIFINIDNDSKYILKKLQGKGLSYIVGGYIRDKLLDLEPKDCDYATILSLEEMIDIFSDKNKFEIRIISEKLNILEIKYNTKKYQIARLREDLTYYNNRKNFDFNFTNEIEKDLLRRDFTINAFAYDSENLFYIDEKCLKDIQDKKIKFLGDTNKRIKEDPFRILRFFRFFSEKNLEKVCVEDLNIIRNNKELIWTLPLEMIQSELIKIIKGNNYLASFHYINELKLFETTFYINEYKKDYDERIKEIFKYTDKNFLKKLNFSKKLIKKLENF